MYHMLVTMENAYFFLYALHQMRRDYSLCKLYTPICHSNTNYNKKQIEHFILNNEEHVLQHTFTSFCVL